VRRDQVALAPVTRERLLERGTGFVGLAGQRQHLREVGVCIALAVEPVGVLGERDCLDVVDAVPAVRTLDNTGLRFGG
jgi:hypothetical protein